ncbi:hypothetical protein DL98DRAFT_166340 [Cadophora sp. DSE1049]|nr:hypothetical protein DL98DRAFT_166340 [Cadophora sp. DSE1049]
MIMLGGTQSNTRNIYTQYHHIYCLYLFLLYFSPFACLCPNTKTHMYIQFRSMPCLSMPCHAVLCQHRIALVPLTSPPMALIPIQSNPRPRPSPVSKPSHQVFCASRRARPYRTVSMTITITPANSNTPHRCIHPGIKFDLIQTANIKAPHKRQA